MTAFQQFRRSYIEAVLWHSVDDDDVSLDETYDVDDLVPAAQQRLTADAAELWARYAVVTVATSPSVAAHDLWWCVRRRVFVGRDGQLHTADSLGEVTA